MDRLIRIGFLLVLILVVYIQQNTSLDKYALNRQQHAQTLPSKVTVGISWPFKKAQDGFAQGLLLAKEQIEAKGGLQIELISRDDNGDWETARKIALEFAGNADMSAVMGYRDDSIAIMASGIYEQAELLHIIVGATTNSLTEHDFDYLIRSINPVEDDVLPLVLAAPQPKSRTLNYAMVWEAQDRSSELAYQYQIALNDNNGVLIYQKQYDAETMNIRHIINQVRDAAPDMIYFSGSTETSAKFLRITRDLSIETPITLISKSMNELQKLAGKEAMRNLIYLDFYDPHSNTPENIAFLNDFQARFGKYPDTWAAQAYDALTILANAVRISHSSSSLDLSSAIKFAAPWYGANGIYNFNAKGELLDKPVYVRVLDKNGEYVDIN